MPGCPLHQKWGILIHLFIRALGFGPGEDTSASCHHPNPILQTALTIPVCVENKIWQTFWAILAWNNLFSPVNSVRVPRNPNCSQ